MRNDLSKVMGSYTRRIVLKFCLNIFEKLIQKILKHIFDRIVKN